MMKKLLICLGLCIALFQIAIAQTPPFHCVQNPAQALSSNAFPLNSTTSNKVQWIYNPQMFGTGGYVATTGPLIGSAAFLGLIDTLWFRTPTTTSFNITGFEVSLGQNVGTTTNWTSTTFVTGLTSCFGPTAFSGSVTASGWVKIPLTTPFLYNPNLSLVVEIRQSGYSAGLQSYQSTNLGTRRIWGAYAATTGSMGTGLVDLGMNLVSPLTCATPTALTASGITQTSALLNWTENNTTPATTWQIEYGPQGFTPTGIPNITTSTKPHLLSGLNQNTSYTFFVRSYCGVGDSSYWAGPYTFTTLASCPWPTNLTAINVTQTSADLNWTENGTATTWDIEIGLQGFTPTGVPTFTTSTKPYTVGPLSGYTYFSYYVRSVCGGANGNSVWSGPFTFIACNALNGTYTLDPTLPASSTNFTSWAAFKTALVCGITGPVTLNVNAATGPYNEQVEFVPVTGASAVNTITINGNGAVINYNASLSTAPHTIALNDADYFRFKNLTVGGLGATYALSMHLWNNADNNTFTNCTFNCPANGTSTTQVPFSVSGSATSATTSGVSGINNIVDSCTMFSGYYNTVFAGNTIGSTGNVVRNSNLLDFYFYGSYNLYQNGVLIENNIIQRPTRTTLSTFYGVYLTTGTTNSSILRNKIMKPLGTSSTLTSTVYGIYCLVDGTLGNENKIFNNLICNFYGSGTMAGLYLTGADYIKAYHNTIILDDAASTAGTTYGVYNTGTVGGIDIKDNIIHIARGGTGTKYCIYYSNLLATSNYNDLYLTSTAGVNNYGYVNAVTYTTLAALQVGSAKELNSVSTNPIYANSSILDFTPTNVSLNDLGTPVGVLTDINLASRSATTPDMGAWEFSVNALDMAALSILSPVVGTGCYSATQTISVNIKNFGFNPIDFSLNPVTVTASITGALNQNISTVLNTGTLASGATTTISIPTTVNMSTPGTYTIDAWTSLTGDGNINNDSIPTPNNYVMALTAGTVNVANDTLCMSGNPNLTLLSSYGGAIQWQESSSATGPWTNVGTGTTSYVSPTITTNMFYRVKVSCNGNEDSSAVVAVTVLNPQIVSVMHDTLCINNQATLVANPSGSGQTINWYDAQTGGTKIDTGITITTLPLSVTDTFWAVATYGAGAADTAKPQPHASIYSGSARGYHFTAPVDFTITGLEVAIEAEPAGTSPQNIAVLKTNGNTPWNLWSAAIVPFTTLYYGPNVSPTGYIPVNIPVFAGERIAILGQRGTANSYSPASSIVIDGNTVAIQRFIMQANLNTTAPASAAQMGYEASASISRVHFTYSIGCEGGVRTPVYAVVGNPPSMTVTPTSATICDGDPVTLNATGTATAFNWSGGITNNVAFNPSTSNTYTVTGLGTTPGCDSILTVPVTVNPLPTVTASATPNVAFCGSSTVTLTGSGSALTYSWTGGATNGVPFLINAPSNITYTVTGVDANNCSNSDTITVNVNSYSGTLTNALPTNTASVAGSTSSTQSQPLNTPLVYCNPTCNIIAGISNNAANGSTIATVTIEPSVITHNGQPFVPRWFEITPTNNGSADVALYLTQDDFDDYNTYATANGWPLLPQNPTDAAGIANLRITKNDNAGLGVNPIVLTPSSVIWDASNMYWVVSFSTPSFSQFRLHSVNPNNAALPVELVNFNVQKLGNADLITWQTANEQNNDGFNVQKSLNGNDFNSIAYVKSLAPNGNSTIRLNYESIDNAPQQGHNYYRLEQVDMDGKKWYSQVLDIVWGNGGIVSVYPNPAKDILNIDIATEKVGTIEVKIMDMSGRIVKSVQMQSVNGMNAMKIDLTPLASGLYNIQVFENGQKLSTHKVRKQ